MHMMRRFGWRHGLRFALFAVLAIALVGLVVMSLWNWLMPDLFGWHALSFVQALGLLVLARLLLGGWRGGHGRGMHWRARMIERWESMSEEERERFRQGMRAGCGHRMPPREPGAP
jgi:hypothetical protein